MRSTLVQSPEMLDRRRGADEKGKEASEKAVLEALGSPWGAQKCHKTDQVICKWCKMPTTQRI